MNALKAGDAAASAVQKTPNRVTLAGMEARVMSCEYLHPVAVPHLTIAVVILDNGFSLVGKSASADPENFNAELGRRFAYEDALRQMWQLEGYLLRERLWGGAPTFPHPLEV